MLACVKHKTRVCFFQYYITKGWINLYQMPAPLPPPAGGHYIRTYEQAHVTNLNDCMYRNMYRYKYVVTVDFDEFVTPSNHTNYHDMMTAIDKRMKLNSTFWSYTFRNVFHLEPAIPKAKPNGTLRIEYYNKQAPPHGFMEIPKSFVDPRRCLLNFNHFCTGRFPGTPRAFTIDVPTDIAVFHHFRNITPGSPRHKLIPKHFLSDDISKYSHQIKPQVIHALNEISNMKRSRK